MKETLTDLNVLVSRAIERIYNARGRHLDMDNAWLNAWILPWLSIQIVLLDARLWYRSSVCAWGPSHCRSCSPLYSTALFLLILQLCRKQSKLTKFLSLNSNLLLYDKTSINYDQVFSKLDRSVLTRRWLVPVVVQGKLQTKLVPGNGELLQNLVANCCLKFS